MWANIVISARYGMQKKIFVIELGAMELAQMVEHGNYISTSRQFKAHYYKIFKLQYFPQLNNSKMRPPIKTFTTGHK